MLLFNSSRIVTLRFSAFILLLVCSSVTFAQGDESSTSLVLDSDDAIFQLTDNEIVLEQIAITDGGLLVYGKQSETTTYEWLIWNIADPSQPINTLPLDFVPIDVSVSVDDEFLHLLIGEGDAPTQIVTVALDVPDQIFSNIRVPIRINEVNQGWLRNNSVILVDRNGSITIFPIDDIDNAIMVQIDNMFVDIAYSSNTGMLVTLDKFGRVDSYFLGESPLIPTSIGIRINHMALSESGQYLVVNNGKLMKVIDINNLETIMAIRDVQGIEDVFISSNGERVGTVTNSSEVLIWDVQKRVEFASANGTKCEIVPPRIVNSRVGPGILFQLYTTLQPNEPYKIVGQAIGEEGKIWWLLENNNWVASNVVDEIGDCDEMPAVMIPPPSRGTETGTSP